MNKLVKIRIDPKPELAIPIWCLYPFLCTCLYECVFLQSSGANYSPDLILLLIFAANSNEALLRGTIEHPGVVCCCLAEFLYLNWLKGFIVPECVA